MSYLEKYQLVSDGFTEGLFHQILQMLLIGNYILYSIFLLWLALENFKLEQNVRRWSQENLVFSFKSIYTI